MVKISLCVITKDEAKSIARCLESVKDIVNEMIVVDTGSTDDTVTIARKLGAKTFYYKWRHDFSAARNYALGKAKGDWIVFLDADEYIVAKKKGSVRRLIQKIHTNQSVDALKCVMIHLEGVAGAPRSMNSTVRIFRNSREIRYEGLIHESIVKRGHKTTTVADVKQQEFVVYHTGYTKQNLNEKIQRNSLILEKELEQGLVREFTYCYLSSGYYEDGHYEKAIEYAHKAIDHMGEIDRDIDYKPYLILIKGASKVQSYNEAAVLQFCEAAIYKFPHHPEVLLEVGLYHRKIGQLETALTLLLQAVAADAAYTDFARSNDFNLARFQTYLNIAQLYALKNQPLQALEYYIKALQIEKQNQTVFRELLFFIRQQEPAEVIYFLNSLYDIANEREVRFLVKNLSQLKIKKVLDYYHRVLLESFQEKAFNGLVLLHSGKLDEVFPIFVHAFIKRGDYDMELLLIMAIFMYERPDLLDSLGPQLHDSFKKIIAVAFYGEDLALSADDFFYFREVVREMAYMGFDKQVNMLLSAAKRILSMERLAEAAKMLVQHGFFQYAFALYEHNIFKKNASASIFFEAGYCCYRLKNFSGVVQYFTEALKLGYKENIIFQFLQWSYEQCQDNAIKEDLALLKSFYN